MASADRKRLSKYEFAVLASEVDGLCPLCGEKLIDLNISRQSALSEAAHIYPHSPSDTEAELLKDLPRLVDDPESVENLILLCPTCHEKFDNPRTADGYMQLYNIKKKLLVRESAREHYKKFPMEEDLVSLFQQIGNINISEESPKLSYNAIAVDEKMCKGASIAIKNIVKRDIRDYYLPIKEALVQVENTSPGTSDLIAKEVSLFYSNLKKNNYSQDEIYFAINEWLDKKTKLEFTLITPFVTAFYVQNCEVFS